MGTAARPTFEDRSESVFGWVNDHWQHLLTGAALLAALAGGFALYERSQRNKEQAAETALLDAQRSMLSGNLPLAQSDLQKVVTRFDGTSAADRATIALAQVLFEQKKYPEGIAKLTPLADSRTEGASAQGLIATGYEEQGKYKEAAEHFMKAADASAFDADKANFKASAARAYMRAGDGAAAKKLWTELAADPNGPAAGEARVRLGELSAAPVAKS
jgi:predicted negative regulator of RcsB-dependent stress response